MDDDDKSFSIFRLFYFFKQLTSFSYTTFKNRQTYMEKSCMMDWTV